MENLNNKCSERTDPSASAKPQDDRGVVSELGTALPEVALAKGGGDTNALPPDGGRGDVGIAPYEAKPHKERWKSGLHHASAIYAKQVVSGRYKRQCCRWEQLACQRFLDDLKRQGTKDFPY